MGSVSVECIHLLLATTRRLLRSSGSGAPFAAPTTRVASTAPNARKSTQADRAELKLGAWRGMDYDRSWVQLAKITVDEHPGADEKNGDQQFEHS